MKSTLPLLVFGLCVHLVLIYSIFDIYYTSPVISGVPPHEVTKNDAPASRLVVFSADGLRFDTFSRYPDLAPFLQSLVRNGKAVSGLSRSHVPTESRPGHVAIFAGFTEDVSAVARGWKHNPVPFDSVVNRSNEAWLWGSPDIVTLFDRSPHAHIYHYSENDEDFGDKDAYKLDEWVFDRVQKFLKSDDLSPGASGQIFFLHLLGIDTNGHGNKPHSKQYKDNLKFVDNGIERISKLFSEAFPDNKTAFLFTSDHGMTDWGSHGAGSDEEVLTPFVAWGAGFKAGGPPINIEQIDIAPLMSALLGLAIPVNSLGIIPIQTLDASDRYKFQCAYANFLELKEQILALRSERSHRLWFRDFSLFGDTALKALETELLKLAKAGRFSPAVSMFIENSKAMKMAIFHYHRYDRTFLGGCISASFIAWIILVYSLLTNHSNISVSSKEALIPNRVAIILLLLSTLFSLYCKLSITNLVYVLLPIYILSVAHNISAFGQKLWVFLHASYSQYRQSSISSFVRPACLSASFVVVVLLCILVFCDRSFLTAIFLALMFVPNTYPQNPVIDEWSKTWRILCLALSPFPFFPNVGGIEIPILCVVTPMIFAVVLFSWHKKRILDFWYLKPLAVSCVAASTLIFASAYLFTKSPLWIRAVCWLSIPCSIALPSSSGNYVFERILFFLGGLFVPYALLSISYESLFVLLFIPLLLILFRFEFSHLSQSEVLSLTTSTSPPIGRDFGFVSVAEWRRSCIYVLLTMCALFGTGNFASINSFNPSTLRRFISIFSPVTMASLLVTKMVLPLLMVSLVFSSILRFDRSLVHRISCLILLISDTLAMYLFYQLKDEGSWLDIGLSISQYLVAMVLPIVALLMLAISNTLMTSNFTSILSKKHIDVIL